MSMHAPWMTLRAMTQDQSVKNITLKSGTVKRIFKFAKPYQKQISFFIFTVVIDSVLVIATPLLFARLIDQGVLLQNKKLVTSLALVIAALALLESAVNLIGRYLSSRVGEGLIYDLRSQVFDHVQRQSIAFFTRTQTGALISRINSDVMGAQQAFTSTLSGVVSNGLSVVLVLGAMFFLSWKITVISLVLVPLFLIPSRWIGKKIQGLARDAMSGNADMGATMNERFNVSGALLVMLYGSYDKESKTFRKKARRVADIGIQMAFLNRLFFVGLMTVASIATAITYGIGGQFVISKNISVGTLLALSALLARLYGPLTALANVRVDVMTALVSFERVFEVLDLEPMVRDGSNPKLLPTSSSKIVFDKVTFTYPRAEEISLASLESAAKSETIASGEVLKEISFTVEPGQMVALVGPSGAGKTTIISLLPRLFDVSSGTISVNGIDVRDLKLDSLRHAIGSVMQDPHLFHDTIDENLKYAKPDATAAEIEAACRAAQIWDLILSLPNGVDTMVGERGYRLSGGEKARLAIARLLLKNPQIVLLDEATAHLDSENEALVQRAIREVLKDRTSLVIAHRLSTIISADQILVVEEGKIAQRGTHEQLISTGGLYSELYARQFTS
ncbi:MAG: ABC transporter ATP-binding protein [Candidatus Nanopelagicaceae bacterium]|nr:ABC transporter ATP-binding protein [Candidatus Nanopelagicaceae bacterium]